MSTKPNLTTTEGVLEWASEGLQSYALDDADAKVAAYIAECVRLRVAFDEFERGYGRVYNVAIVQNLRDAIKKAP